MEVAASRRDLRVFIPSAFFLLLLLVSRFLFLGWKPYHHDESQYACFAMWNAQRGGYRFDPILHGPFHFYFQALLFKLLPINDLTGRLPVALAGVLTPILRI